MTADNQKLVQLLYDRVCPYGYRCLSVDCMECAKLQAEQEQINSAGADK